MIFRIVCLGLFFYSGHCLASELMVYRWVDKNNIVHFSQHQPVGDEYTEFLVSNQSKMIGCFYISNGSEEKYDASVFIWVRKEYLSTPIFIEIKSDIKNWISKDWPLKNVDYSLN